MDTFCHKKNETLEINVSALKVFAFKPLTEMMTMSQEMSSMLVLLNLLLHLKFPTIASTISESSHHFLSCYSC